MTHKQNLKRTHICYGSYYTRYSQSMNAELSETIQATILGLGMQIPEIFAHRKFISAECYAHSNAHKPPKTVAPTVLMLE